MSKKATRGQKAAKTLGKKHMAKIGAKGGSKTKGRFALNKKLAREAQKRSVIQRKINKLRKDGFEQGALLLEAERDSMPIVDMDGVARTYEGLKNG